MGDQEHAAYTVTATGAHAEEWLEVFGTDTLPVKSPQPHLASAEKGETLFGIFVDDVAAMIERVIRWDGTSWNG